jgi:hypothetical protein
MTPAFASAARRGGDVHGPERRPVLRCSGGSAAIGAAAEVIGRRRAGVSPVPTPRGLWIAGVTRAGRPG